MYIKQSAHNLPTSKIQSDNIGILILKEENVKTARWHQTKQSKTKTHQGMH